MDNTLCEHCNAFKGFLQECSHADITVTWIRETRLVFALKPWPAIYGTRTCALCRLVSGSLLSHTSQQLERIGQLLRDFPEDLVIKPDGPMWGHGHRFVIDIGNNNNILFYLDATSTLNRPICTNDPVCEAGSMINPLQCTLETIRGWHDDCLHSHGNQCNPPTYFTSTTSPTPGLSANFNNHEQFFLVDVLNMCIVRMPRSTPYVALSYVWGGTEMPKFSREDAWILTGTGVLYGVDLPATLADAFYVTKKLGERYLWTDSLCIFQDEVSILNEIARMDEIFGGARITIVAAGGESGDSGIPGVRPGSRVPLQTLEVIADITLSSRPPRLMDVLEDCAWNTRAWTLQELLLSKRLLIFSSYEAYYVCQSLRICESGKMELPRTIFPGNLLRPAVMQIYDALNFPGALGPSTITLDLIYGITVEKIMERKLTIDHDILRATRGIFRSICEKSGSLIVCGLMTHTLEWSLLWLMSGACRRRCATATGRLFPSWSWAGWVGKAKMLRLHSQLNITPLVNDWSIYVPTAIRQAQGESLAQSYVAHTPLRRTYIRPNPWDTKWHPHPASSVEIYDDRLVESQSTTQWPTIDPSIPEEEQLRSLLGVESAVLMFTTWTRSVDIVFKPLDASRAELPWGFYNVDPDKVDEHDIMASGNEIGKILLDHYQMLRFAYRGPERRILGAEIVVVSEGFNKVAKEAELNILWVERKGGIYYRLAIGKVKKKNWDLCPEDRRKIALG